MTDKTIRLCYPNLPTGDDYSDLKYQPRPAWGDGGDRDYPTVRKVFRTDEGSLTKSIKPIDGGPSYSMSNIPTENTWKVSNEDSMWDWNGSELQMQGTTNPMSMLIGHKGPQSNNDSIQSWQRNVVGISMYHKNVATQTSYFGHYIQEMTLLYRKGSDTSNCFHGVDLIYSGNLMANARRNYDNQSPFKTNSPIRGGTVGSFYCCIEHGNNVYEKIQKEDYVFQGVYMRWGGYEGNSPASQRVDLGKLRLIYDSYSASDNGGRICTLRSDRFDHAWDRSRPMKLT